MKKFDVLIIMGRMMGVYDDREYQCLPDEKNFIFDAIREDKKVIGICLGAQLLACVLGATIYTNKYKKIGWFPIQIAPSFSDWLGTGVPEELIVFHWHGDKFDNPYCGVIHASSEACNHQLFTYGDNIIGLQFHLEATSETVRNLLENCLADLVDGVYIQKAEKILDDRSFEEANLLMRIILEKICSSSQKLSCEY